MSTIYKSDTGQRRVEEAYRSFLDRWPVPAEFVTVPTRHGDTFVVACGPKDAPPVVFLHGSTANSTTWLGEIAAYASHFRCYCVDLIGEPGLSAPNRPDEGSDAYVLWLDDLLDGLGIAQASFVAISLGGLFAFQFGAARPDRVVAIAGNAPAGICRNKNFVLSILPYLFMGKWGKRKIREAIMGEMPTEISEEAREFSAFFEMLTTEFKPRMLTLPCLSDNDIRNLGFPVYVVLGGQDVMLHTKETRDRLQAFAPDAVIDFRPDARHYIAGTQNVIVPFLRDVNGI